MDAWIANEALKVLGRQTPTSVPRLSSTCSVGSTHVIGTVKCVIERADQLESKMRAVAQECGFKIVGSSFVQFEPFGATGVLVLAESHFSFHTFPEDGVAKTDVYCCAKGFDAAACVSSIERVFGAGDDWIFLSR